MNYVYILYLSESCITNTRTENTCTSYSVHKHLIYKAKYFIKNHHRDESFLCKFSSFKADFQYFPAQLKGLSDGTDTANDTKHFYLI